MNLLAGLIQRRTGLCLLALGVMLLGIVAYFQLPVAPLPTVDFPTIQVTAKLSGASAETMATSVATPLERAFAAVPQVTSMTSSSSSGKTQIVLQFDLSRNIDGAAQDVQTAINTASATLPNTMTSTPTFNKVNPAEFTVLSLALTSPTRTLPELDRYADNYLAQRLSQMPGVGLVDFHGEQKPAVRIQIDPDALAARGLTLEEVRGVVGLSTLDQPKGNLNGQYRSVTLDATDQLLDPKGYREQVVAYKAGVPIKLGDLGRVIDAAEDTQQAAGIDGQPTVIVDIHKQPGFNVLSTIANIKASLPGLTASLPRDVQVQVIGDRTQTINASVNDVQFTLLLSIALVVVVIFVFLRKATATLIPTLTIPLSLVATFAVMYLLGYSLDNLSIMGLAIAVGFVVDDAIVVMENIVRHLEMGKSRIQAALDGLREVGFTIVSMTVSLIAVFLPILLMGGIVGRLMREFAVTVSVAILMSGIVSLTVTPMLCAWLLKAEHDSRASRFGDACEAVYTRIHEGYRRSLEWVLDHQRLTLAVAVATFVATAMLYLYIPKGFFPQQDTGLIQGVAEAASDISPEAMRQRVALLTDIVSADPAVAKAYFWIGPNPTVSQGRVMVNLKPFDQRSVSAQQVIARLQPALDKVQGIKLFLQANQDIQIGGRASKTQYQYTLQDPDSQELEHWSGLLLARLKQLPQLRNVTSDQQRAAPQATLVIDRPSAARLGVNVQAIDDVLYDAFGQRQIATMFTQLDQNHVILELDPRWQMSIDTLKHLYVRSTSGAMVPLDMLASIRNELAPIIINHQGVFPAITLSFDLAPGQALSDAVTAIEKASLAVGLPDTVSGSFQGTAQAFKDSLKSQPWLILAAILTVYIVLGVLYENAIHPLTIISTLPSAGFGALLALIICGQDLSVLGMIGIILLIGIVKKNAIMIVDFTLEAERGGMTPREAVHEACLLRLRPILMTSLAALLGAVPLAFGHGAGSELRQPLGIAIVGGLVVSQLLTLYTTPVVYLWFDRLRGQKKTRDEGESKGIHVRRESTPGVRQ
ncbi:efflux RND transporter permease subunit [Pseudomonas sp. FEN]|uniref:efflux RND transporter permease subunit n=1 Tax=Pseudomonas sp. FEN TaxID=2767468 RepID=UPI001749CF71|nr:efflux RND transporter permease subunit [Pseudomonas sp. FEN]CAD5200309.1 Multidrug efflux system MdtABC-TolC, inner-membrane proton/drug antiporter MdtC (RND type) [Pseudomonas sp. FEN]